VWLVDSISIIAPRVYVVPALVVGIPFTNVSSTVRRSVMGSAISGTGCVAVGVAG